MRPTTTIAIHGEIARIRKLHPNHDPGRDGRDFLSTTVLAEECGEVAKAVLDMHRDLSNPALRHDLFMELLQVAAFSIMWLENLEEANNGKRNTDTDNSGRTVGQRSEGDGGSGTSHP